LLAVTAAAQPQAPTPLPAREVTALVQETGTLLARMGMTGAATMLEGNRSRIQQGFTPEVYQLLMDLRSRSMRLALAPENTTAADRARLTEIADRLDAHLRALLAQRETRLRNPDRDNLARYAEANRALPPPAPGEQRVAFLGDSITDGWRLHEYFVGKPYVNRGISGQITGEMLGRMKADVLDNQPAAMVVLAGTNDLARGVALPTVKNNLAMIGMLARAAGIQVIFASVLPVSDYAQARPAQTPLRPPEKILEINRFLEEHCRQNQFVYLDYHTAMKDDRGLLRAELADDGLHPNAAGYRIMAPLVEKAIAEALAPPKTGRAKRK
jgi:lysophospholipase L1-like esterase